ncbi:MULTISPECIES: ABC transporter substrate-binding protein [unclassified Thalassospira]|jgi:NitT/TauT family transport system substrate-binding protein|uniref:ABC transporter substrate-binding protein n=1 Tax=unclassified Thalassospira TaxID=2648997 RepID=UPI000A1F8A48|nr:ABC transporter substrate-binding protein [Thalassospira sp. MCCC 1A01428]
MGKFGSRVATLTLGVAALVMAHAAKADTPIKFSLDWKFEGHTAPYILAKKKGYFSEEGLDVTIDSGNGSVGAITRVASGAYDISFADINSLVEFNASHPDQAMKSIFMVYDRPPFSLFMLKKSGITKPEDLKGKTLGAPVFDASRKLFPAFAKATGLSMDDVKWESMDPPLREPMLVRGDVDGISGHYFTSVLNLESQGIKKEDMVVFKYADYGLDFYGNGILASKDMMENHGDQLRGFLRAVVKGWRDTIANPDEAIAALKEVDPLIDTKLETERLNMVIEDNVITDEVLAHGMGPISTDRMAKAIDQVSLAFGLQNPPKVADIFTSIYMPGEEERKIK